MSYIDPAFEARRNAVTGGTKSTSTVSAPSGGYVDTSFEKRRQQIIATPKQVSQTTNQVQISEPVKVAEKKNIISRVVDNIKGFDIKEVGKAFVGGTKTVPGQLKTGGGVILSSIIKQNNSINDFFTKHKVVEAVASVLPGVGPSVQSRKTQREVLEKQPKLAEVKKIGEQKVLETGQKLREQGYQESTKARQEYEATKKPSTGLQRISELVAFNLPVMATSLGLTAATSIVTKNPVLATTVGLSTSFSWGASEVYGTAREYGLSDSQALPLAQIGGTVIGALDFAPIANVLSDTGSAKMIEKSIISKISNGIIKAGLQGGLEAVTENLQDMVGNAIAMTYDQNKKLFDLEQIKDTSLVSLITGGLADVTVGGVTGILGRNAQDSAVTSDIEKKIETIISTPVEKRTPEQQQIAESILSRELTPNEAMQMVSDEKLTNTDIGKTIVKAVAQAQSQNSNIKITPTENQQDVRVELVDKQEFVKPEMPEGPMPIKDIISKKQTDLENKIGYTPAKNLTPEQTQLETKFGEEVIKNYEQLKQEYIKANDHILNTDQARELSEDYRKNKTLSAAVHEPASSFIKKLYLETLTQAPQPGQDNSVLFTAGGTGAGKTTAINTQPEFKNTADKAQIVYDTNLSSYGSAKQKIDQALAAGKNVEIIYVYRDIVESMMEGAVPRSQRMGRTVPLEEHISTHTGSLETIRKIVKEYGNNTQVNIGIINNSLGKGNAKIISIESLKNINYNVDDVRKQLQERLKEAYSSGKLDKNLYEGFVGVQKESPGPAETSGAKSQQSNKDTRIEVKPQKPGEERPGTKESKSKLATFIREQMASEIKPEEILYQGITLDTAANKSIDIINNDPQLAQNIIDGYAPAPNDTTKAAVMIAAAESARKAGKFQEQADLVKQRFFMQNRHGQEIVSERLVNDLSTDRFIKDVLAARLAKVVKDQKIIFGKVISKATNKIETQARGAKKKIDKMVISKLESAQSIIDSLTC